MTLEKLSRRLAEKMRPGLRFDEEESRVLAAIETARVVALCEVLGCGVDDLLKLAK